jgi:hypothetical protein
MDKEKDDGKKGDGKKDEKDDLVNAVLYSSYSVD